MNGIADANQEYGALTGEFYIAGFAFERAMARVLGLLKDGAWRQVGDGFDDVNTFVRSLDLDHFKVVAEQRKEFSQRVKELQPDISNRAIADALGVGKSTIYRDAVPNGTRDGRKGQQNRQASVPNGPRDGRRDAARIVQRDEREERREEKLTSVGQAAALQGLFPVIYADPPWQDEFGPNSRQVELHYPVMTLDLIKAVCVPEISSPDAVLYLWALPHMIPAALEVMAAWGFDYRTQMIWGKDKIGLGEWVRQQHEILMIGRRGDFPPPPPAVRSSSIVTAPLSHHSAKPDVFAELIERWYPEQPKIELFRRGAPRPGWSAWGNEAAA